MCAVTWVAKRSYLKDDLEATLTLVVTDVKVTANALAQVGRQAHSSLARAIQPFHSGFDGNVLFIATMDTLAAPEPNPAHPGVLVSELA